MSGTALKIAEEALELSSADETEVIVREDASALARFAENTIHQHVASEDVSVTVRAVVGRRVAAASSNDVSKEGLAALVESAREMAASREEDPDFPGLPEPRPVAEVQSFYHETAGMSPADRAGLAAEVVSLAATEGASASGTAENGEGTLVVASSRGVRAEFSATEFSASALIEKGAGSGYAAGVSRTGRRVNAPLLGRTALEKCLGSAEPRPLEPGEYAVILEPQAVADLLGYTALVGFGAQAFHEGRSFVSGRIGERLFGEEVSIWDDGLDEEGLAVPFDYEGVPKQHVSLVERGVARGVVYDSYYAAKAGCASTGHALGPGFSRGPLPTNLFMAGGGSSLEEMVRSASRAVLVTRFHYVNVADAPHAVLTGLTRDGTFLVEDGAVSGAVGNLRFTESMLRAFSNVEALSRRRELKPSPLGAAMVPAAMISSFRFTGAAGPR